MIDYEKLRMEYFTKRLKEISNTFEKRNPIYDLNTGLIDKDSKKVSINEMKLQCTNTKYKYKEYEYLKSKQSLNIAYLLPHNLTTGGLKVLIEQSENLKKLGHNVSLYAHVPKPEWIDISCKYFQVPPDRNLYEFIPTTDAVIAGYWDLILDAIKTSAPLKYYIAQGDKDIFEYEALQPYFRNTSFIAHQLPVKILTVSNIMKDNILSIYKRDSIVISNAINTSIFYPQQNKDNNPLEILLVGSDSAYFKGHFDILKALYILKDEGCPFRVKWVMPCFPQKDYTNMKLNIQYHIKPTQEELGRLYRTSDIYISGSYYEAFSLPPLEAMASGTAVITTDNDGAKEYCVANKNSLMFRPGNIPELMDKMKLLMNSVNLRNELIAEGIKTSQKYSWENAIISLNSQLITDKNNIKTAILTS